MSFPARTLLQKLSVCERPVWACYLPREVLEMQQKLATKDHGQSSYPEESLVGQVWDLSQGPRGCRQLQLAMGRNSNFELLETIGSEFVGHVIEATRCPNANHVLQLYITKALPEKLTFILDELRCSPGGVEMVAKHKFGCRIVQRLMEHLLPDEAAVLAEAILGDVLALARHPYGNYVLQNLLEHGSSHQKKQLALEIQREIVPLCQDHFGSAVVSSALSKLAQEDMLQLAHSILHVPGLLVFLAHSRHGHASVRHILSGVEGLDLSMARELLEREIASLRASRYGRMVIGWLSCSANSHKDKAESF